MLINIEWLTPGWNWLPRPSKGGRGGSWRCELWEALEWRLLTTCSSSLESFKVEVVERELPSRSLKAGIDLREGGLQLGKGICPHYETLKHDDGYAFDCKECAKHLEGVWLIAGLCGKGFRSLPAPPLALPGSARARPLGCPTSSFAR